MVDPSIARDVGASPDMVMVPPPIAVEAVVEVALTEGAKALIAKASVGTASVGVPMVAIAMAHMVVGATVDAVVVRRRTMPLNVVDEFFARFIEQDAKEQSVEAGFKATMVRVVEFVMCTDAKVKANALVVVAEDSHHMARRRFDKSTLPRRWLRWRRNLRGPDGPLRRSCKRPSRH
ncbi:hypothetical protein ABZP36_030484 [Zizania latifolia]